MKLTLRPESMTVLGQRDMRLLSYNVEMTELMGGTFWKPYTQAQIEGTEKFPVLLTADELQSSKSYQALFTPMDPIDLYEPRIRTCAKALGPAVVRYSGSWATCAYYRLGEQKREKEPKRKRDEQIPEGYATVLNEAQWNGALDFAEAVDAEILVSLANCRGNHKNGTGVWMPDQAKRLWDYTISSGRKIHYVEFMNQPDIFEDCMLPEDYTLASFCRDHDIFAKWLGENYPETKLVGLSCCMDVPRTAGIGISSGFREFSKEILENLSIKPEIFSCHSYAGSSERIQGVNPTQQWKFEDTLSEAYLGITMEDIAYYASVRDQFIPNGDIWVTESGDAYGGGNTWASTFVEAIRFIDELCRFAANCRGIIFHNTLASSAYGLLNPETHLPRPQYWAGLLFNTLAGSTVYDTHESIREGVHLYAFSRRDGYPGKCCIYINNSRTEACDLTVPDCMHYCLSSDKLRSEKIFLNGEELKMKSDTMLPDFHGRWQKAGSIKINPCTINYLIL